MSTPEEFARGYAERSGISMNSLAKHGFVVLRCACEEEGCHGWQMQTLHWMQVRRSLGLLEDDVEFYPLEKMLDDAD